MNNSPFADIFSGIIAVCLTCIANHFHNKYAYNSKRVHKTIQIISKIQQISHDLKNIYCYATITHKERTKIVSDLVQLNMISLIILARRVNNHIIWKLGKQDLNWIYDYLNVMYMAYTKYPYIINNYNKAYKKIFKFHKRSDKYEIKSN